MDTITPEHRSWNMAQIRSKETTPERKVRSWLFSQGFRFRKNDKRLPGKPDIVMPKYKTVIFVHGCFWHRHQGCKRATMPKSNTEYWEKKFKRNVDNDAKHFNELVAMGWNVIVLWECELNGKTFDATMQNLLKQLKS